MLRTYLSLVVARLDGEIVRDLVAGNGKSFTWGIVKVQLSVLSLPCHTIPANGFLQVKLVKSHTLLQF